MIVVTRAIRWFGVEFAPQIVAGGLGVTSAVGGIRQGFGGVGLRLWERC